MRTVEDSEAPALTDSGAEVDMIEDGDDTPPASERPAIRFYNANEPFFWLTNFAPSRIAYGGRVFANAEAFFQASKFIHKPELYNLIARQEWPRAAFNIAQENREAIRSDWKECSLKVMHDVQMQKYQQNPFLAARLSQTGTLNLIEASPEDSFWGIGPNGQGENHLGQILMLVRSYLLMLRDKSVLMTPLQPVPEVTSPIWRSRGPSSTYNSQQLRIWPSLENGGPEDSLFLHGISFDEDNSVLVLLFQIDARVRDTPTVVQHQGPCTRRNEPCVPVQLPPTILEFKIWQCKLRVDRTHFTLKVVCHAGPTISSTQYTIETP